MTGCEGAAQEALACFQCVCVTWTSLLGFVLPLVVAVIYLPRVLAEATADDWIIVAAAALLTYASRKVSDEGIAHIPYMLAFVAIWAVLACDTDRTASLRSLPMIWFMVFASVLVPDLISAVYERPEGATAIPGGRGLIDGLVLKPLFGVGVTLLAYGLKVRPLLPKKSRRGLEYDEESMAFLFNASPAYRRPAKFEGRLVLRARDSASTPPGHTKESALEAKAG